MIKFAAACMPCQVFNRVSSRTGLCQQQQSRFRGYSHDSHTNHAFSACAAACAYALR